MPHQSVYPGWVVYQTATTCPTDLCPDLHLQALNLVIFIITFNTIKTLPNLQCNSISYAALPILSEAFIDIHCSTPVKGVILPSFCGGQIHHSFPAPETPSSSSCLLSTCIGVGALQLGCPLYPQIWHVTLRFISREPGLIPFPLPTQ